MKYFLYYIDQINDLTIDAGHVNRTVWSTILVNQRSLLYVQRSRSSVHACCMQSVESNVCVACVSTILTGVLPGVA
jgi:hypothetical protein